MGACQYSSLRSFTCAPESTTLGNSSCKACLLRSTAMAGWLAQAAGTCRTVLRMLHASDISDGHLRQHAACCAPGFGSLHATQSTASPAYALNDSPSAWDSSSKDKLLTRSVGLLGVERHTTCWSLAKLTHSIDIREGPFFPKLQVLRRHEARCPSDTGGGKPCGGVGHGGVAWAGLV